jgi:hypothetical protein
MNGQEEENIMATAVVTADQNAVIAEIFIAAPPARVFQAISDPNQLLSGGDKMGSIT